MNLGRVGYWVRCVVISIGRFSVQTPPGARPDLGIQPRYGTKQFCKSCQSSTFVPLKYLILAFSKEFRKKFSWSLFVDCFAELFHLADTMFWLFFGFLPGMFCTIYQSFHKRYKKSFLLIAVFRYQLKSWNFIFYWFDFIFALYLNIYIKWTSYI